MNRAVLLLLGLGCALAGPLHAGVDTAWVRRYDGPAHLGADATGLALDNEGNVIVAGVSLTADSTFDWITIRYLPNGDTAWVRSTDYDYGRRKPSGLGVDGQGNIYVAGTSNTSRMVTVKYDSTGHQKWVKFYGSQALCDDLVLDNGGDVIICGGDVRASNDCVIIKYRPNGDTAWARFYDWVGYDDDLDALFPTSQGDICAVGFCSDTSPGGNILTIRYDSVGNRRWAAVYDGPQHGADWPSAIAADQFGNCCIAGISDWGYGTPWDYLTIKYDSTGETLWTRRYAGSANQDDKASAIAIDAAGSVIVTGYVRLASGQQCTTIKYSPTGDTLWVARFERNGEHSAGSAITVDSAGCAYVAGGVAPAGQYSDYLTVKYSPLGETLWTRSYNGPGNSADYCNAIALGRDGSVCVTGGSQGDIVTIKYVQNGGVAEGNQAPVALRPALIAAPSVFSRGTAVRFCAGRAATAQVTVFDAGGRRVRTLVSGPGAPGLISVTWDGCDDRGRRLSPGVYIFVLEAGEQSARVKVVVSE